MFQNMFNQGDNQSKRNEVIAYKIIIASAFMVPAVWHTDGTMNADAMIIAAIEG